jgi:3-dehydroquinate dehydratase I
MRASKSGKGRTPLPRSVAVLASPADLGRAARLRRRPDLFELRLDALCNSADELERAIPSLRAPLIVTARHPAEGGANGLTTAKRRALLLRFLARAEYIDVELRSVTGLAGVLQEAARLKIKRIISVHDFHRTPPLREIEALAARAAAAAADVFKLVTRTDTGAELQCLLAAFEALKSCLPMSAMGVGKLGRESRAELVARGSVLNYAHLGTAQTAGQLSLAELHRLARIR